MHKGIIGTARGPSAAGTGPALNTGSGPTPEDRHADHKAGSYNALGTSALSSGASNRRNLQKPHT